MRRPISIRRLPALVGVLTVVAAAALLPGAARSDGSPTADLVAGLTGPAGGSVGDTLTFTVSVTNKGPDAGTATVIFAMSKGKGLEVVDATPGCPISVTPSQVVVTCEQVPIDVGTAAHLQVRTRVTEQTETTVDALAVPSSADPDTTNNAVSVVLFPVATPPPPSAPVPVPPAPPPYEFVPTLRDGRQYRDYQQETLRCLNGTLCSARNVTVVAGELPPGLTVTPGGLGLVYGKPFTPGTYTFTLEAQPDGNATPIRHDFTLHVGPFDGPPAPASSPPRSAGPSPTLVGETVLVAKRRATRGCKRGSLPDRRCSPGAYYSKLTKAAICKPGFRASSLLSVPPSEERAVENEYGIAPSRHGRSIEIDHIIPLELGGSNDMANLFPEPGSGRASYRVKDALEHRLHAMVCGGRLQLRAARTGLARNWQSLYRRVYDVAP